MVYAARFSAEIRSLAEAVFKAWKARIDSETAAGGGGGGGGGGTATSESGAGAMADKEKPKRPVVKTAAAGEDRGQSQTGALKRCVYLRFGDSESLHQVGGKCFAGGFSFCKNMLVCYMRQFI